MKFKRRRHLRSGSKKARFDVALPPAHAVRMPAIVNHVDSREMH